ncbi:MAG TPA: hypothetical protein VJ044_16765, partial [Candidatus Hodarchaeales archaeon]|nr:hypothetical protein [Candidatus Hodarchaeales archaeon]
MSIYKHIDDHVEPDFFFWNKPLDDLEINRNIIGIGPGSMDLSAERVNQYDYSADLAPTNATTPPPSGYRRRFASGLTRTPQYIPVSRRTTLGNENGADAHYVGADPEAQGNAQSLGGSEGIDLNKHMQRLTSTQYTRTARSWVPKMSKAFPTYFIYFIFQAEKFDEGKNRKLKTKARITIPNAVISLSILRHKKAVEVAEIEFTNQAGDLDNSRFRIIDYFTSQGSWISEPFQKLSPKFMNSIRYEEPTRLFSKEIRSDENFFAKHIFSEGTRIVVKLGYASDPEDLETVFTGYI